MHVTSAPLLSVSGLRIVFDLPGGPARAVDDVSFDIAAGETLGLVGESGSGKSVTALAMMRLLRKPGRVDGGTVRFTPRAGDGAAAGADTVDLLTLPESTMRRMRGRHIGFVFQEPMSALDPVQTVGAQIAEALHVHGLASGHEARRRSVELLDAVRIPNAAARVDDYPHQLSGGMRQRVMIAMAIACEPEILFADEPTTALDVTVQAQVLELMGELRQRLGMAMVIITHDLGVVATHTDKIAVMYGGEVVEIASTKELFANMRHPYTEALMKSIPRLDRAPGERMPAIAGTPPDPVAERVGCAFAPRCAYATDKCHKEHPELTDAGNGHAYRCFFPLGAK